MQVPHCIVGLYTKYLTNINEIKFCLFIYGGHLTYWL